MDDSWKNNFQKYFVCRYCDKHCTTRDLILLHLNSHLDLLSNCHKLIKRHCNVQMNRIDSLPNIAGNVSNCNIVVLNSNTLVFDGNNLDFYITYLPKAYQRPVLKTNDKPVHMDVEISDDDEVLNQPKSRKRPRLLSDTTSINTSDVDLETVSEFKEKNDESDSTITITKNGVSNNSTENVMKDISDDDMKINIYPTEVQKTVILSIVLGSYNKSVKKINCNKFNINNDMLNRKVLCIGRKIMTKKGMPSTGLLKYLEHKNLIIDWRLNNIKPELWKQIDYIRVMTRTRDKEQPDGFKYFGKKSKDYLKNKVNDSILHNLLLSNDNNINYNDNTNVPNMSEAEKIEKIILNLNPVPNPKQAPKQKPCRVKHNSNVSHDPPAEIRLTNCSENTSSPIPDCIYLNDSDDESKQVSQMPIITSTTSLAPTTNVESKEPEIENVNGSLPTPTTSASIVTTTVKTISVSKTTCDINNGNDTSSTTTSVTEPPRIKCKPVTELMSSEGPVSLIQPQNRNFIVMSKRKTPKTNPSPVSSDASNNIVASSNNAFPSMPIISDASLPTLSEGYIILDTVCMPNTPTNSPFTYFKNILKTHGITLLDVPDPSFVILVKFKLIVKHDSKSVLLVLNLIASREKFCIKVKDGNNEILDVSNMSANWQWEILKAFQDDTVIVKTVETSRNSGASGHTEIFLNILKSIKKITP